MCAHVDLDVDVDYVSIVLHAHCGTACALQYCTTRAARAQLECTTAIAKAMQLPWGTRTSLNTASSQY